MSHLDDSESLYAMQSVPIVSLSTYRMWLAKKLTTIFGVLFETGFGRWLVRVSSPRLCSLPLLMLPCEAVTHFSLLRSMDKGVCL